jgi:NTE family protein
MKKTKIALILGGGGARGLAHIGVLKALEENGIAIDMVIGTSMGAMVGAVYAQNPDAKELEKKFVSFLKSERFQSIGINRFDKEQSEPDNLLEQITKKIKRRVIINLAAHRQSLFKGERLMVAINQLINEGLIQDAKLPFACSALDLSKLEEVIFDRGDIRTAVSASSSIPGFLPPVEIDDELYVDGSICTNFPWVYTRNHGADIIIAVDVTLKNTQIVNPDNVIDIIMRTSMAANYKINRLALDNVDFVIRPALGQIFWNEFDRYDSLIELGYTETKKCINSINEIIYRHNKYTTRIKKRILKIFGI